MQKAFSFKNLLRHVFAVVTLTSLFLVSTGCSSQAAQTEPVKETKPAAAAGPAITAFWWPRLRLWEMPI